jgi:hypothetical protein
MTIEAARETPPSGTSQALWRFIGPAHPCIHRIPHRPSSTLPVALTVQSCEFHQTRPFRLRLWKVCERQEPKETRSASEGVRLGLASRN